jgi:predicted NUDIX family NTP pyrophosphohydrolase
MAKKKLSAGIMLYKFASARRTTETLRVLIAHMGGPYWEEVDEGGWSFPKGEYDEHEEAFACARREFAEEMGAPAPEGEYLDLGVVKQPSGKCVHLYALEADFDVGELKSNTFEMMWPPRSGRLQSFPEIDGGAYCTIASARTKLLPGQRLFLDVLVKCLRKSNSID